MGNNRIAYDVDTDKTYDTEEKLIKAMRPGGVLRATYSHNKIIIGYSQHWFTEQELISKTIKTL